VDFRFDHSPLDFERRMLGYQLFCQSRK
jgi:hypothetical protein